MWQVLRGGSEVSAQWLGHSVPDAGTGEAGRASGCREMDWRNTKGLGGAGSSEWSVWLHLCPVPFDKSQEGQRLL